MTKKTPGRADLEKFRKVLEATAKVDPNDVNLQIATLLGGLGLLTYRSIPKNSKPIPLKQIVGGATNLIPELNHKKCGCPGLNPMSPTITGDWYCENCNGHVKKSRC